MNYDQGFIEFKSYIFYYLNLSSYADNDDNEHEYLCQLNNTPVLLRILPYKWGIALTTSDGQSHSWSFFPQSKTIAQHLEDFYSFFVFGEFYKKDSTDIGEL